MFDFMKDMSLASHGVDMDAVNAIKAERRERKNPGSFIFSIKAKIIICVLLAFCIAIRIYGMTGRCSFNIDFMFDVLFVAVALVIGVFLWVLGKKGEVISLCGMIGLFIGLYVKLNI